MRWLRSGLVLFTLMTGCAFGRTEFRVLKPTPEPSVVATIVPTTNPTPSVASLTAPSADATEQRLTTYVVQPGDSLWRISRRLYHDPLKYQAVAHANHIKNPDLIQPGQQLNLVAIPGGTLPVASVIITPEENAQPQPTPILSNSASAKPHASPTPESDGIPVRSNRAFGPGEKLNFSVEYFGVSAGFATLTVQAGPLFHNRPTLHLSAVASTHPAFEWFFKVRDQIDSFFDSRGLFSWKYEKHLREGNYSADSALIYHQFQKKVMTDDGRTTIEAQAWTQDVLSEFYYFRTLEIKLGDEVTIPVVADDGKSYELLVKVLRKATVNVPAGKFNCVVVQPFLKFEGLFQSRGKIEIWLTDDNRKVPVLIKSAIVIGTIDIVLRSAEVVEAGE